MTQAKYSQKIILVGLYIFLILPIGCINKNTYNNTYNKNIEYEELKDRIIQIESHKICNNTISAYFYYECRLFQQQHCTCNMGNEANIEYWQHPKDKDGREYQMICMETKEECKWF